MRLRVLVVDDDPTVRGVLTTLLGFEGVDVTTAEDGPSALSIAERLHPDVVLLDVNLPGKDGFAVCRELKLRDGGERVVMITGRAAQEDELVGLAAGADAFLRKPFSPLELIETVRTSVNGKGRLLG
ncbi:MAG: response regulator transcription factor [Actinomycetota bacterium]